MLNAMNAAVQHPVTRVTRREENFRSLKFNEWMHLLDPGPAAGQHADVPPNRPAGLVDALSECRDLSQ